MMRTRLVAPSILIVTFVSTLFACGTLTSPFTKSTSYDQAKKQWNGELLLPTELFSDNEQFSVTYNKSIHAFEATSDKFVLIETKTNDASIAHLSHGQLSGESIDDTIKRVQKQSKPVSGHSNEITQIEKISIGKTVGYWYEIQNDDGLSQLVEFVKDGIQVYVRTSKDKSLSKRELLQIANSFETNK